jgi:pimeloyl-ACP methyl ester carboxylesterase
LDSVAAKNWPVVAEERMVPTSYGATFVRVAGPKAAPPIVLLHGAAATSLMWAPNIEALSTRQRTYAVDQIGEFGKSLCCRPLPSLDDLVTWLDELFDALELHAGLSLVGISYGGALAEQYALHFPTRLDKVVLLAPGNTVLRTRTEFWVRLIWAAIARQRGLPSFLRWIFAEMARNDPKWIDAILEQLFMNMRNLERRKTPIPPVLTDAEWGRLQVPALFLIGEHDVIYSPQKAVRRLKRVAPRVTAEIVPGAGHDFTVAHDAAINARILEFLKQEPAARRPSNYSPLTALRPPLDI